jgi:hypothetical protein
VSLFSPAGHLPDDVVAGLPLPGPSLIAANATPVNDIVSAMVSAATNNVMRLRLRFLSHPPCLHTYYASVHPLSILLYAPPA